MRMPDRDDPNVIDVWRYLALWARLLYLGVMWQASGSAQWLCRWLLFMARLFMVRRRWQLRGLCEQTGSIAKCVLTLVAGCRQVQDPGVRA